MYKSNYTFLKRNTLYITKDGQLYGTKRLVPKESRSYIRLLMKRNQVK
jgi:hypothetical protein